MNLNKALVIGRLTADPQLRTTPGGQSVTSFSVATNRVWTDKNGSKQEEVEFHNIVVWARQAEIATQFLTKGSLVFIEGRLQTRSWQDKEGQSRKTTEIICERLQLGPRPAGSQPAREKSAGSGGSSGREAPAEDIPVVDIDSDRENPKEDLPF